MPFGRSKGFKHVSGIVSRQMPQEHMIGTLKAHSDSGVCFSTCLFLLKRLRRAPISACLKAAATCLKDKGLGRVSKKGGMFRRIMP